jgi:hypothetical protein
MRDEVVEERQRLADAVKHHQRDRNRAPSEPAGKFILDRLVVSGALSVVKRG